MLSHLPGCHHLAQNVAIQHALHRDAVRGGRPAREVRDGLFEHLPVVGTGPPQERAVDIKQDQR